MAGETPGWYCRVNAAKDADAYGEVVGGGLATTNTVTASATGGSPPYIYAWTRISGASFSSSATNVAAISWSFAVAAPDDRTETWRCTITDASTATGTVDVTVQIVHSV